MTSQKKMSLLEQVTDRISKKVGLSADQIKTSSPEQIRAHISQQTGKQLTITTEFPFIGRGNVLRDGIVSSSQINRDIDCILGA